MPTEQDIQNASGLADFQKDQIEQSNGWPTGSLGRGGPQPTSQTQPGQIAGGSQAPDIQSQRMRLVAASKQGTSSKWWNASDVEVQAEFARLQRAAAGGGGGGGGGDEGYNPGAANIALQLAQAAAQQKYLDERLRQVDIPQMQNLDARERERLALEKARDAFNQAYQQAQVSGYTQPAAGQGIADRAQAAWDATPAEQRGPQTAANIWKQQIPGLSDAEAQRMAQVGQQYYLTNKTSLPNDVAQQYLSQITGGRISGQTPSLQRETNQNQTMINLLDLQSRLRGPGDWVQYMQTVQSTPPELRNVINQAAGRFQMPGAQPGAASVGGLIGDLNRGPGAYANGGVYGGQPAPTPTGAGGPMATQPSMRYAQGEPTPSGQPVPGGQPRYVQPTPGEPMVELYGQQAGPPAGSAYQRAFGAGNPSSAPASAYQLQPLAPGQAPPGMQPGGRTLAAAWDPFQRQTPQTGLPLANQLPRSFATASPDVQDMILSPYEAAGQSKRQVVYDFEKSLPQYGGPTRGVRRY